MPINHPRNFSSDFVVFKKSLTVLFFLCRFIFSLVEITVHTIFIVILLNFALFSSVCMLSEESTEMILSTFIEKMVY